MIYPSRGSYWSIVSILFIVLVCLLFLFSQTFAGWLHQIGRPIWQLKNPRLEKDFSTFSNAEVQALLNENLELKNILGRNDGHPPAILAAVLAYPPVSPFDSVIIDIGEDHGLKVGERAMALGNLAIGEVASVEKSSAVVKLYSAPGNKFQVSVVGSTTIAAAADGRGGGNFSISVPIDTPIDIGASVTVPGIRPILIGTVEKIDSEPNDSFKTVYFKLPVNVRDLKYLEIETQ